ncbi:MAG: glutaredoxin domain-containing protein [Candidatus Neomarinimicrobiota bacterium]
MIDIYTITYCPYCSAAKRLLEHYGFEYNEINIEKSGMTRIDLQNKTGGRTVPQIVINGKFVGGYENLYALHSNDSLKNFVEKDS